MSEDSLAVEESLDKFKCKFCEISKNTITNLQCDIAQLQMENNMLASQIDQLGFEKNVESEAIVEGLKAEKMLLEEKLKALSEVKEVESESKLPEGSLNRPQPCHVYAEPEEARGEDEIEEILDRGLSGCEQTRPKAINTYRFDAISERPEECTADASMPQLSGTSSLEARLAQALTELQSQKDKSEARLAKELSKLNLKLEKKYAKRLAAIVREKEECYAASLALVREEQAKLVEQFHEISTESHKKQQLFEEQSAALRLEMEQGEKKPISGMFFEAARLLADAKKLSEEQISRDQDNSNEECERLKDELYELEQQKDTEIENLCKDLQETQDTLLNLRCTVLSKLSVFDTKQRKAWKNWKYLAQSATIMNSNTTQLCSSLQSSNGFQDTPTLNNAVESESELKLDSPIDMLSTPQLSFTINLSFWVEETIKASIVQLPESTSKFTEAEVTDWFVTIRKMVYDMEDLKKRFKEELDAQLAFREKESLEWTSQKEVLQKMLAESQDNLMKANEKISQLGGTEASLQHSGTEMKTKVGGQTGDFSAGTATFSAQNLKGFLQPFLFTGASPSSNNENTSNEPKSTVPASRINQSQLSRNAEGDVHIESVNADKTASYIELMENESSIGQTEQRPEPPAGRAAFPAHGLKGFLPPFLFTNASTPSSNEKTVNADEPTQKAMEVLKPDEKAASTQTPSFSVMKRMSDVWVQNFLVNRRGSVNSKEKSAELNAENLSLQEKKDKAGSVFDGIADEGFGAGDAFSNEHGQFGICPVDLHLNPVQRMERHNSCSSIASSSGFSVSCAWTEVQLTEPAPPFGLDCPVIDHLLVNWSPDSAKVDYLKLWLLCTYEDKPRPANMPRNIQLLSLSQAVKDGFIMLIIPILQKTRKINVMVKEQNGCWDLRIKVAKGKCVADNDQEAHLIKQPFGEENSSRNAGQRSTEDVFYCSNELSVDVQKLDTSKTESSCSSRDPILNESSLASASQSSRAGLLEKKLQKLRSAIG